MDNTINLEINDKAKQADITMPVALSESLVKKLRPNQYLVDIGIDFDKRLENLFELVRANLELDEKGEMSEKAFAVPLVVVNGPFVREDVISIAARLQKSDNGEQTIFITDLQDTNNEYED